MTNPAGKSNGEAFRLDFDRRLTLQFRGSVVTSDAGLLAYRELDDALGLSDLAGERLADARTGKNGRHALLGMLRQAVFGRLADTRMSTTPSDCAMIPRCDGSSAEGGSWLCSLAKSNGPLRNAMAHGRKESFGACRSLRPMD